MAILYKTRGESLPTVVFHGDHVYEFMRVEPNTFELETDDREVIGFLVDMGFKVKENKPIQLEPARLEEPVDQPEPPEPKPVPPPVLPKAPRKKGK